MSEPVTYESKLKEMALADPRLVVMTAENRAAIRNLPAALGERFVDTGITEQTMIGMAAGLALRGRVPVTHALATFLTMRAFEFIRTDVGIPGFPVKLVGGVPGVLSEANGPTHQAVEDIALMRGIPGMEIFCPGDQEDLVLGLEAFLKSPQPGYLRFTARKNPTDHRPFHWGQAEVFGVAGDVALLCCGALFPEAWEAKQILEQKGMAVQLVNVRTVRPLDEKTLLQAVRGNRLTVPLEDHFLTGGLYSAVAETLLKHQMTAKVLPIGLDGKWFKPALLADVLEHEGFTGAKVAERVWRQLTMKEGM